MESEIQTPSIENLSPLPEDKNKNKLMIYITIIVAGVLGGFLYFRSTNNSLNNAIATNDKQNIDNQKVTPTSFPFQEMTIPSLRSRSYKSSLGEKNVNYQGSNYTAYLTDYDSDGIKINGLLTEPTGEKPKNGWPAIVFIHGYIPPAQYGTTTQYYDYVDYLARNGFVVFKIDLRGHGNSEGEASGSYFSADYIIDVLNAYSALQNTDFVNKDKIGLWGHSMAGNVSLRAMTVKPEIPAVVIWGGAVYSYTDREKYGINDNSYIPPQMISQQPNRRQRLINTHGDYDPNHYFWKQFTPTNYLQDLKGAIQLNHAVDDDVVNIGYSRDLIKLLDQTDVPHEIHEYPSGGHNISGSSFVAAMEDTVAFYKKYLNE